MVIFLVVNVHYSTKSSLQLLPPQSVLISDHTEPDGTKANRKQNFRFHNAISVLFNMKASLLSQTTLTIADVTSVQFKIYLRIHGHISSLLT